MQAFQVSYFRCRISGVAFIVSDFGFCSPSRDDNPFPIAFHPMNSPASTSPQSALAAPANMLETPDAVLVEHCCAGDLNAFDVLVERHQDRIFNVCYWMLGSRDEAADACQDAWVRAWRALSNFRGESAFGTWLHRIAVNAAIDAAQRRKRAPLPYSDLAPANADDDDDGAREKLEPSTPFSDDPAQRALREERRLAVRNALATLPEHYRIALVLLDIEGYTYEEIAQTLKLPLGTVKSRINRARCSLRERLQETRELFEV